MIIEGYKYVLDELYVAFKDNLYDIVYKVENDEDVTADEVELFRLHLEQLKDEITGVR